MRKLRGQRNILEVDAADAVFSQTPYVTMSYVVFSLLGNGIAKRTSSRP